MSLHIEISGDASPREWRALQALAAAMLGETSRAAIVAEAVAKTPPAGSVEKTVVEIIGKDADRPDTSGTVPEVPAAVVGVPVPPVPEVSNVPPPPTASVELDSNGLPWDGRIHASTKTKVAAGSWTKKRGVDENLVRHVEAELRAILAAPAAGGVPVPPFPSAGAAPVVTDPATAFGGAPSTPVDAPPAAEPAAAGPMAEFARVMRIVNAKQAAGTMSTEMSTAIAQQLGLTKVGDLALRADLIPAFEALLP